MGIRLKIYRPFFDRNYKTVMKILVQAHLPIFYILFCHIPPGAASVNGMFMTSTPGRLSHTFTPSLLNVTLLRIRRSFAFPACMLPSECLLQLRFMSSLSLYFYCLCEALCPLEFSNCSPYCPLSHPPGGLLFSTSESPGRQTYQWMNSDKFQKKESLPSLFWNLP